MMMRWTAILCASCLALIACRERAPSVAAQGPADHEVVFTSPGGDARLLVRVADSDVERASGLMWVQELAEDQGMAFVFEEPTDQGFWMKNTLIPLSIAFVDHAGTIVTIREMEPCETPTCPMYWPDAPFVLAVEANAGWFDGAGVAEGDRALLVAAIDG